MQNPVRLPRFCFRRVFASDHEDFNRAKISDTCALKAQRAEKKNKPFPKSEDSTNKPFEKSVQERT